MADIHFENRDCVEAMKEFPDNFFDLAIVDPPYGGGLAENGGCKGWFSKYHQDGSQTVNVGEHTTDSAADSTSTRIQMGGWHGKQKYHLGTPSAEEQPTSGRNMGAIRSGGQWAAKYAKKSFRGMSRRSKNILTSCFASHVIRLYGGGIISRCLLQGVS